MHKKFTEEEKKNIVSEYSNGQAVILICNQYDILRSTLYSWINQYQKIQSSNQANVSYKEYFNLKKRVDMLEERLKVIKEAGCSPTAPQKEKLAALEKLYGKYSVHALCDALDVPRETFYNHIFRNKRENTSYQLRRDQLCEKIKQIFDESNQIYGAKKIKVILTERGEPISDKMVAELMQEMNLYSIRTGAKKNHKRFNSEKKKDILKMNFSASEPNRVWVSDVTCFKVCGKYFYICAIVDLYFRRAVAYNISRKHSTQLITKSFKEAYAERHTDNGLIFNSDQGSSYTAHTFQALLKSCNAEQSFPPTGKPCHNAVMESFFSNLKREELYRTNYPSVSEFKERMAKYINFYNIERPHTSLNYKSPNTHERLFFERVNTRTN